MSVRVSNLKKRVGLPRGLFLRGKATKRATIVEPSCAENIGRLFPRIALGGYDGHPSHYLGKALEKARKNLDGDNSNWDMHSFRRAAVSALVDAGVSREVRNLVLGHSNKDDIGISVYLSEALSFCREGDVLIVTKLDRLARSVRHLGEIVDELTEREPSH